MKESQKRRPRVIIIGAGFGGLQAAKKLARKNVLVTVIDRTNYHLFQPLLYQVATAALSPADIAAPVRSVLSKSKNVEVILAEVKSVDVATKKVKTTDSELTTITSSSRLAPGIPTSDIMIGRNWRPD